MQHPTRFSQCFLSGPATPNTRSYHTTRKPKLLNPGSQTHCFSIHGNQMIVSPVSVLLSRCRPPTIARPIIPVVIPPFDCMFWRRTKSHIRKKVFKPLPSFTNFDPPAPVIFPASLLWIPATIPHNTPNPVFYRFPHSVSFSPFSLARNNSGVDCLKKFDVFRHIGFSGSRFLLGGGCRNHSVCFGHSIESIK